MVSTRGVNSIRQGTTFDNSIACLPGMRVNTRHMNPTNCTSSNSMTVSRTKIDAPLAANAATQVFMHQAEACNVPVATLLWHCFTLQLYRFTLWYCVVLHYNYIVLLYDTALFYTTMISFYPMILHWCTLQLYRFTYGIALFYTIIISFYPMVWHCSTP